MRKHDYVAEKTEEKEEVENKNQAFAKEVEDSLSNLLFRLERVILNATINSTRLEKDGKAMETACKCLNKEAEKIREGLEYLFFELKKGNLEVAKPILEYLEATNTWISHVAINLEIIASKNTGEQRALVKQSAEELKSIRSDAATVIGKITEAVTSK